jgi:GT2 family glycosyltransferase
MTAVDVVIATRDRPDSLRRCLEELAKQTFSDFGVIVVDDGSSTAVAEAVTEGLAPTVDVRFLRNERSHGPGHARNVGVRASEAEFVAFIDDDVRATPELLQEHYDQHRRAAGSIASIGPLAEPPRRDATAWNLWEARNLEREYERMRAGSYQPTWRQFHTGNVLLRRADFWAAGGFDERFRRAEDIELGLRLALGGVEFVFAHSAVGWHYAERSLDAWLRIPKSYARCDVAVARLHPRTNWLDVVQRERGRRHPAMRLARTVLARSAVRGATTRAACGLARRLHAAGATGLGMSLLSLAYDVEYDASLREAMRIGDVDRILSAT